MDPPEFTPPLRKALVPWFSRKTATDRSEITRTITDYVLDQIIEAGECDLTEDVAVPVRALLTMDQVGFPFAEAGEMADMFHRHTYVRPGTPGRDQLNAEVARFSELLLQRSLERRNNLPDFTYEVPGWNQLVADWQAQLIEQFTDGSREGERAVAADCCARSAEIYIAALMDDEPT